MKPTINPLLAAIGDLRQQICCIRVYTSVHKDGTCRVKFYGAYKIPLEAIVTKIYNAGWKSIYHTTGTNDAVASITLFASK